MKKCVFCTEHAAVVYFPGNVKDGLAYCPKHFPKNIQKYYGTEYVVSAYAVEPPAPVPVQVEELEPVSEDTKKRSKKKVSEESVEEPVVDDVVEEAVVVEQPVEE